MFDNAKPSAVVVDTGNYYPRQRDGRIADIEAGMNESRWVEEQTGVADDFGEAGGGGGNDGAGGFEGQKLQGQCGTLDSFAPPAAALTTIRTVFVG